MGGRERDWGGAETDRRETEEGERERKTKFHKLSKEFTFNCIKANHNMLNAKNRREKTMKRGSASERARD